MNNNTPQLDLAMPFQNDNPGDSIVLDKYQQIAHDNIIDWYKSNPYEEYKLAGYAGTGKTTILYKIANTLQKEYKNFVIHFCAYTGKASEVLFNKVGNIGECSTIHSLIYKPIIDQESGLIIGWDKVDKSLIDHINLIIIDEASMVGKEIFKDIKGYGIPILCVGDHGQLGSISNDSFNLMKTADYKLEKIHRQAADNPIIKLSFIARTEGYINRGIYGPGIAKLNWYSDVAAKKTFNNLDFNSSDTQIICGMNKTRVRVNNYARKILAINEKASIPTNDEKIICLQNNKILNIMNGSMGYLRNLKLASEFCYNFQFDKFGTDNYDIDVIAYKGFFGKDKYDAAQLDMNHQRVKSVLSKPEYVDHKKINAFDFGYCISVHKSQGSEFSKVVLIEERNSYQSDEDYARWLYTAVTRASSKLLIIEDF